MTEPRILRVLEITGLLTTFPCTVRAMSSASQDTGDRQRSYARGVAPMMEPVGEAVDEEAAERIELSFPARPDFVVLARFAAATVAARAGFDVEEIEDLRLAVDELFVSLGPMARDGCMRMELERSDDTVSIVGAFRRFRAEGFAEPRRDGQDETWEKAAELSELLLDSLVDEHGRETRNGRPTAWLRKRRTLAK